MSNFVDFPFTNSGTEPIRLILEPWAREYLMETKSSIRIRLHGVDSLGNLEMDVHDVYFIIYAPNGSTDVEIIDPEGTSMPWSAQI